MDLIGAVGLGGGLPRLSSVAAAASSPRGLARGVERRVPATFPSLAFVFGSPDTVGDDDGPYDAQPTHTQPAVPGPPFSLLISGSLYKAAYRPR